MSAVHEYNSCRVLSSELSNFINQEVTLSGWLHKKRVLGKVVFVLVRDRKGLTQVVIEDTVQAEKLKTIYQGSVITVRGTVRAEPRAYGGVELYKPEIIIEVPVAYVSPVEIDKPIDHSSHNLDTLFEHRVLTIRNPVEQGIWKIQEAVQCALRAYLKEQDFTEFHSPKLLAGSTEGGAEVFKLDYFGQQATLAQSAQFYKQIMVGAFERVFEFGRTYRAEPSMTTRHMTEFITLDVEMGFITSVTDVMSFITNLLTYTVDHVWEVCKKELLALGAHKPIIAEQFPVITLEQLHELCYENTGQDFRGEKDPAPFEERWVGDYGAKTWSSEAVFITQFPAHDMKFYHYRNKQNPHVTDRFDLLFRGIEIITGSRREHRYEKLIEQMKIMGINPEDNSYNYYLEAFRYGMPSHGGFGLGLERLTQKIIGLNNVKEAALFPRDTKRLAP